MAHVVKDRVQETSTTTGTGAFTLAGAVTGFRAFSAVCSTSDTVPYIIEEVDANGVPDGDWETGFGTYSAANTLTRTTVLASSNAGAAVNFAAGDKRVAIGPLAANARWTQIATASPSAVATVDFTSIPQTYSDLTVVLEGVSHDGGTNGATILEFSDDGGSTFTSTATLMGDGFAAASTGGGSILIPNYTKGYGAAYGAIDALGTSPDATSVNRTGAWRASGGLDGLRVAWSNAANFDAGTITLYGR